MRLALLALLPLLAGCASEAPATPPAPAPVAAAVRAPAPPRGLTPAPATADGSPDVDRLYHSGHDVPGAMVKADPSASRGAYAEMLQAMKRRHRGARRSTIALACTLAQFHLAERGEKKRLLDVAWEVEQFVPPRGDGVGNRPDIAGAYYIIQSDEGTGEDGT